MTATQDASVPPPVPLATATGEPVAATKGTPLLDRLNPILIREVQQAFGGRMFTLALWASLLGIVVFALWVAVQGNEAAGQGLEYFASCLSVMAPVLLFVVPIQAFVSMRSELQPGTAEQLFLSRLRPGQIVRGKLMAAMVQYAVYVAVFAPLLSTLYMLQGLDLPTIGLTLLFSLVLCLATTVTAIAAAALARFGPLQPLAYAGVAFGLGMLSIAMMGAGNIMVRELSWLRRLPEFWDVMATIGLAFGFGAWLLGMVAASQLTHEHENRSTPFRVFAFVILPVGFLWTWYLTPERFLNGVLPGAGIGAAILVGTFGWFAVTESRELSPRARAHAPRGAVAALFAAPWLPGSGRGMIYVVVMLALACGLGWLLPWLIVGEVWPYTGYGLLAGASYGICYLGATCFLRGFLGQRRWSNFVGRVILPALVVLGSVLPAIYDVATRGGVTAWHWGHVSNPFWTMERHFGRSVADREGLCIVLGCGALFFVGLTLPAMWAGVAEVLAASKARRQRAKGPDAGQPTEAGL